MALDITALHLAVFLAGTFVAAFVAALAGFALGVVALAIWLYALTPVQAAALIASYALLVQGHAVWKLRRSVNIRRLLPFVLGSAVGIPAGLFILERAASADLRSRELARLEALWTAQRNGLSEGRSLRRSCFRPCAGGGRGSHGLLTTVVKSFNGCFVDVSYVQHRSSLPVDVPL